MASSEYMDCELFLAGRDHARLSVAGRDYSGRPALDEALARRLLEVDLESVRYGALLFQALFPEGDDLLAGYRENLTIARHEGKRLRMRLHIAAVAPSELHHLHWELLYDPEQKIALGRSQEIALSRYLGVSIKPGKAVTERARLLVVLSCPQDLADYNLPTIDQEALRSALEQALSPLADFMNWEFLEGPVTIESIRDRLVAGRFHALHVTAHGMLPPEESMARLVLETGDGHASFVDEEVFAEVFAGQRNLRLVTLMACHGGIPTGRDPFSGLAPALVRRGVPAVIAMRRQISLDGATRFTEHFYRNLARSAQVDAATNEARLQLYLGAPNSPEWGTPALFLRLAEGRLWDDAETADIASGSAEVKTLLFSDLVNRAQLAEELGDERMAEIFRRHNRLARDLMHEHEGQEVDRTDGFLMLFERPLHAVRWALAFHQAMAAFSREIEVELAFRVGIHLGEVVLIETPPEDVARGAKPLEVEGLAKPIAARLMALAQGGQTLLSAAAFDLARRSAVGVTPEATLSWMAHGEYLLGGATTPTAVYEVGVEGSAPLAAPPDTGNVRRAAGDQTILGWRPGLGLEVPQRPHWVLEKKLSEGGFGEVWLASREKMRRPRVFKFCFEAERLKALMREITLFRLLKEELGDRDDIARILDWNFEQAPYFIESEYAADGDLAEWAEEHGGLAKVPMAQRLEIIAQLATALSAAHSVGVLHKDIKPANVLIAGGAEGQVQVRLADFGIGAVTEREKLAAAGITVLGLTANTGDESSAYSGTRLYMAPELLEGKRATLQTDVYALGVMLYQTIVGDFAKALAPGWRRDVDDELLCEDIALAVDGSPERRLGNALRIAERLRSLDRRRQERESERRQREEVRQAQVALARSRKRWKLMAAVIGVLALFAGAMTIQSRRVAREAETARQVSVFLVDLFKISDPDEALGNKITAREILDQGAKKIGWELRDQPEVQARLMHIIGVVYQGLGLYDAAVPLLETALARRRESHGDRHVDVAESLNALASLRNQQGHFEQAGELSRQALEMRRSLLGERHPDVAKDLHVLAEALAGKSDYEAAENLCLEALQIRRRSLGEQHADVASSIDHLARLRYIRGGHEEAESLYRKSLTLRRRLLDGMHPDIAFSLNHLARLLHARGDFQESEALYREALTMRRQLLGENHPDVASSLNHLAELLQARGSYKEAESFFRESLEMRRRLLGEEHPLVAANLNTLASLLKAKGDYERAEAMYREALALRRRLLGEDHILVASSMNNLALMLQDLGRYEETESLYREAMRIIRFRQGDEHPWVAVGLNNVALSLLAKGDYKESEVLFRESLAMRRRLLGDQHPDVAQSLHNLALLMHRKNDDQSAETLFLESLDMRRELLGEGHLSVAQSLAGLARLLIDRDEVTAAQALMDEASEIFRTSLPEGHWLIALADGVSGICWSELGQFAKAETLLRRSYPILKEKKGEGSWYTQDVLRHIVNLYEAQGEDGEAVVYRELLLPVGDEKSL